MTEPKTREKWPPPALDMPQNADETAQEIKRLHVEKVRFEFLGMRFRTLLLLAGIFWLAWSSLS